MRRTPSKTEITIENDGQPYTGVYWIEGTGPQTTLTVTSADGQRMTQVAGGLGPQPLVLAKMLLAEIARAAAWRS